MKFLLGLFIIYGAGVIFLQLITGSWIFGFKWMGSGLGLAFMVLIGVSLLQSD